MKTESEVRAAVLRMVSRPQGASRRQVRDNLHTEYRDQAYAALAALVKEGLAHEFRAKAKPGVKPQCRYFASLADGQSWAANVPHPADPRNRRPKKEPEEPTHVKLTTVECPPGRFEVRLPDGYKSQISAEQCSDWARYAVAGAR